MPELEYDNRVIDALGGTHVVAVLCRVRDPSISGWRKRGIPRGWRRFLQLLRPDVFAAASIATESVSRIDPTPTPRDAASLVQPATKVS
ncbi:MAG TPA: hypothetical protein VFQ88_14170 [Nevskiaceae bacterium]|nr:hypothetical protein [Nevskiaceae bacterium]